MGGHPRATPQAAHRSNGQHQPNRARDDHHRPGNPGPRVSGNFRPQRRDGRRLSHPLPEAGGHGTGPARPGKAARGHVRPVPQYVDAGHWRGGRRPVGHRRKVRRPSHLPATRFLPRLHPPPTPVRPRLASVEEYVEEATGIQAAGWGGVQDPPPGGRDR